MDGGTLGILILIGVALIFGIWIVRAARPYWNTNAIQVIAIIIWAVMFGIYLISQLAKR